MKVRLVVVPAVGAAAQLRSFMIAGIHVARLLEKWALLFARFVAYGVSCSGGNSFYVTACGFLRIYAMKEPV